MAVSKKLTLNIVIECTIIIPVTFEDTEGIPVAEILELDQAVVTVAFHNSSHEVIEQFVISVVADTLVAHPHVIRVL